MVSRIFSAEQNVKWGVDLTTLLMLHVPLMRLLARCSGVEAHPAQVVI